MRLTLRQRIDNKTDMSAGPDACWPWIGGKGNSGTCSIQIDKKTKSARRVLWEIEHGAIPNGYVVSDSCGNRGCMNPRHLRLRSFILAERFWGRVDRTGGEDACWPYTGYRHGHGVHAGGGYGSFPIGEKGKVQSNRVAWMVTHGPIPDGMHVMHLCDNPPCCNPKHLKLGTHAENMADMHAKGRYGGGPNAPRLGTPRHGRAPEKRSAGRP